ncbi:hypothetical protein CUMW_198560 [Citrus unshiu]|nr:hypothetical protein CUMW_198560 [Citrus unshiu]
MLLLVIVLPLSTALIVVVTLTLKWKLIECWKSRTGPSNDVFHQQYERALKSFEDECEVMKRIRHRNLLLSGEDQLSIQIQTLATIGYMAPGLFEFTTYPLFSIISNLPNYWFFHDLLFKILFIVV